MIYFSFILHVLSLNRLTANGAFRSDELLIMIRVVIVSIVFIILSVSDRSSAIGASEMLRMEHLAVHRDITSGCDTITALITGK